MRHRSGFTLLEVMVALGIVAIALMAGIRAAGALSNNTQRQGEMLLAQLCAENELAKIQLSRTPPGIGESHVRCEQANRIFTVTVTVSATPNPVFRRIDAHVSNSSGYLLRLSTIAGSF